MCNLYNPIVICIRLFYAILKKRPAIPNLWTYNKIILYNNFQNLRMLIFKKNKA